MNYFIMLALSACCMFKTAYAAPIKNSSTEYKTISGGCFYMGNTFGDAYHIEMPVHEVCISSFSISPITVTVGEFSKFIAATGYRTDAEKKDGCYVYGDNSWEKKPSANWRTPGFLQGENHPVVCVSWNDAVTYTHWLSQNENRIYRLPTEAEWEYAARSGGKQERYAGSDDIDKVAWYKSNSGDVTHSVGQKQPNGLGLYDMSGNVWQWTSDWYDRRYYRESPRSDPRGPSSGTMRVFRGGSWFYDQRGVRATYRDFSSPDFSSSYLGFRLVLHSP